MEENGAGGLDPEDWGGFRRQAHRMLDDILDYTVNLRQNPVWRPVSDNVRERFRSEVPREGADLKAVHESFLSDILPYGSGNNHPGFMGWVQGGGTPVGILAEMLAAGLNANLGGRDHAPLEVERQVTDWVREIFNFPRGSTGLFVNGTSMANLTAAVVARDAAGGSNSSKKLIAYASTAVHGCIAKAMDVIGLGRDSLRLISTDSLHRMNIAELEQAIATDRGAGLHPFLIVGTAGTVDVGAIDDLAGLADVARREKIWFHVDGAYGALGMLAPEIAPLLRGIERADSLAFDFHKWGQVPYAAGFLLVRHGNLHGDAFTSPASYLRRESRGLAAGSAWPCDFGVDLSRSFQALKTWFTLKTYGTDALGRVISGTCELARYLAERVTQSAELELMAPVALNVVCFRYRAAHANRLNAEIVVGLQESGVVAPSTTMLNGQLVIRAALVNHRTTRQDVDALIENTLSRGRALTVKARRCHMDTAPQEWLPYRTRLNALQEVEAQISADPDTLALCLERASLLMKLGRMEEARDGYLAALAKDPSHCGALNNLGQILYGTGHRTAARTAYAEAVKRHPNDAGSRVNLANLLVEDGDPIAARSHYERVLEADTCGTQSWKAHQGMSRVLVELGDTSAASAHRRKGFSEDWISVLPYRGKNAPLSLLLLASAEGGNVPVRHLLNDNTFQSTIVMTEFYDVRHELPPHHLVFNSIGDADLAGNALRAAEPLLARTDAPVINPVSAVAATGRAANARRLSGLSDVVTSRTVVLPRELLASPAAESTLALHGFEFPILLRTPGFHTGKHFIKIEEPGLLAAALEQLPGRDLLVMQYLDARGRDGKARKYRVMMIDGQLYPLHLAISSDWKIHYFTAEMANSPEHRAEDAAFLSDMPAVLGPRATAALSDIQRTLGLDYAGIDFGLNEAGELLFFEANATMVVLAPDTNARWNYRRPAVERIYRAVVQMLRKRIDDGLR
jgi:glutamate/tyrosine decarboxylase-like PLP-dependent enzyme/glutathione synthase/RimK-type ligase-like ATP-grasp enzyme